METLINTETLIERLRERAHDPARATDEGPGRKDGRGRPVPPVAAPPASDAQVAAAEARLGFALPPLLRQVYREVGNGGFGPGAGLFALPASAENEEGSVVARYLALRRASSRPPWPAGLLPLCDWGSGIGSYLDCARPDAPVIRLDPNMPKGDVEARVPAPMRFERAALVGDACWVERPSLAPWLEAWAEGRRLFYLAYADPEADAGDDDEEDEDAEEDE